ncbi:hypothetical protein [Streptomyces lydicus]|uniref:hypothetical protein n=1 Tax=Streptomyces lydicus TaxID=47763 RepID=UPI0010106FAE|nr:hypothetical protein [Streptomyces lydicus]MCZ1006323.1 hypothetical protein [Streptomyces lydicus]
MQPSYPFWSVTANGPDETGVTLEIRAEIGAGGGLPGFEDASTVVQAVAGLFAAVEGTEVRITATTLHADPLPLG